MEQERHRYQELFDAAPDAYLTTDPAGIVREANLAAAADSSLDTCSARVLFTVALMPPPALAISV